MLKKICEKIVESASNSTNSIQDSISNISFKSEAIDLFDKMTTISSSISNINKNELVASTLEKCSDLKESFFDINENFIAPLLTKKEVTEYFLSHLSNLHNHASENPLVRGAIDKLAHVEGYGGAAFHRVSDGSHSILGAFEAATKAMPDLPAIDRLNGAFQHLWHDFHSTVGIPVFSFDNHENFKAFCELLHLSPHTVMDFLTVNSTELLSSALTIIPTMFRLDEMQTVDFIRVAAKMGILTATGGQAEILGSLFSLSMLGKAFFDAYHEGESYTMLLIEAAKEGGWTGASVTAFALLPFPISLGSGFVLPILRAKIEADGIEGVIESISPYFENMTEMLKKIDFDKIINVVVA